MSSCTTRAVAKRLECGVKQPPLRLASNVVRERPAPGDVVILLGGRTGRDGIGGATGSSKSRKSLSTMASEAGNAPEERKIQRSARDGGHAPSSSANDLSAWRRRGRRAWRILDHRSLRRRAQEVLRGASTARNFRLRNRRSVPAVAVAPRRTRRSLISAAAAENLEAYSRGGRDRSRMATERGQIRSPTFARLPRSTRTAQRGQTQATCVDAKQSQAEVLPVVPQLTRCQAAIWRAASASARRGLTVERFDSTLRGPARRSPLRKTQPQARRAMARCCRAR